MSFGKIYGASDNPRTVPILVVAKANNLDIELVSTKDKAFSSADYAKLNPQNHIPTFVGADGYVLTETIAISIYVTSQNEKTTLLGKTRQDYASILKWMSFSNQEFVGGISAWVGPVLGVAPYNKKAVQDAEKNTMALLKIFDDHLLANTYLVGERLTLADIFVASQVHKGMSAVLDKKVRDLFPNLTRWALTVVNQDLFKAIGYSIKEIDVALTYQPPKKEAAPKPAAKPVAAAAAAEEEDEAPAAPKAKHPLEALPKPTLILDDWKRKYSNEDTRSVALPWFWENYKPEEYSIWRVDYKYNDELTLTFMSANLIGGFFARLEASRKFLFGACSVYGESNDSVIQGAFLVRGQEAIPAFDVAPDWESYEFTKLNPSNPADKEFLEDQWSWDKPIAVKGKTYEWADGKVFK